MKDTKEGPPARDHRAGTPAAALGLARTLTGAGPAGLAAALTAHYLRGARLGAGEGRLHLVTDTKIRGRQAHLDRAIAEAGHVVDVLLRGRRDLERARASLERAIARRAATPTTAQVLDSCAGSYSVRGCELAGGSAGTGVAGAVGALGLRPSKSSLGTPSALPASARVIGVAAANSSSVSSPTLCNAPSCWRSAARSGSGAAGAAGGAGGAAVTGVAASAGASG